jgi:hypothetical protein
MNFERQANGLWVAQSGYAFGVYLIIKPKPAGRGAKSQVWVGDTNKPKGHTLVAESDHGHPADSEEARLDAIHIFQLWTIGIVTMLTTDGHGTTIYDV